MMQSVFVKNSNSELTCPECNSQMIKTGFPTGPFPTTSRNGHNLRAFFGLAYCEVCNDTTQWRYESADVIDETPKSLGA